MSTPLAPEEARWSVLGRVQEFDAESRVNLVRLLSIACLYAVELANYYGIDFGFIQWPRIASRGVHLGLTFLVVSWCCLVFAVYACRRHQYFPAWLKFATTGADVMLLTGAIILTGGPRSTVLPAYFLVLAMATLRFSLPLLWFAVGAVLASYLFILGHARYGPSTWYDGDVTVPRHQQILFALALLLVGITLGQAVRCVRQLALALATGEEKTDE